MAWNRDSLDARFVTCRQRQTASGASKPFGENSLERRVGCAILWHRTDADRESRSVGGLDHTFHGIARRTRRQANAEEHAFAVAAPRRIRISTHRAK
jgi:hypothetical protein